MKDLKKQYERNREKIRYSKTLSDLEKSSKLFNLWIDYISKSAEIGRQKNIKHEHETVRVRIQYI